MKNKFILKNNKKLTENQLILHKKRKKLKIKNNFQKIFNIRLLEINK